MSYAQWVSIYVCSFMQFVIFCFTDFVYYCMPIYVPSLNKDFIIIIIYTVMWVLTLYSIVFFNVNKNARIRSCDMPPLTA